MKPTKTTLLYPFVINFVFVFNFINDFSGEWISPTDSGYRPLPCISFSLTSLTDDTFVMFGGETLDGYTNATYIGHCTKSTIVSICMFMDMLNL